jgi:excinuclease UvrABC helicase subunit UvrB
MFGFPLLLGKRDKSLFRPSLFPDEFLEDWFGFDEKVELDDATLLDTHEYQNGSLTYEQKVYRLADKSIYVQTKTIKGSELSTLEEQKQKAISEQRFEDAAHLRDKIKRLKTK